MKLVRMLILALGLMTIVAASSFAAVPFFTSSTVNIVPINARTGLAGSILFTPLVAQSVIAGEIINIAYETQISMLSDIAITVGPVVFPANTFSTYGTRVDGGAVSVTINKTSLMISFDDNVSFAVDSVIRVDGVRLDVAGMAVRGGLTRVLMTNTTGQATVINPQLYVATFEEPLLPPVVTGSLTIGADGQLQDEYGNYTNFVTISVSEVFTNAFDTRGGANSTQVQFALSNIPTGVAFSTAMNPFGINGATVTLVASPAPTASNITLNITDQDGNSLQGVGVQVYFRVTDPSVLPIVSGTIGVTAKLVPAPTAPYPDSPITGRLRFADRPISSVGGIPYTVTPVVSFLFSTYNEASKFIGGSAYQFDTGFAIANTSGSGPKFLDGEWFPSSQPGAIEVCLYPQAGGTSSPYCFTTSATKKPGRGLDDNGMLGPKKTWSVLLSELLPQTTIGATEFRGYVTFLCNFRGGQGINFIADGEFDTTAQGYPMFSTDGLGWRW